MTVKPLIVSLVGLPGSGKTTVGRQLAKRLRLPFVDSDHEIEVRIGEPIRLFFEDHGEAQFRDFEEQILQEIIAGPSCVLSTGGGAVLRPGNRKALHDSGHVVYLKSNPEELFKRLRHDQSRPLLQVADPLAKLRDLFATRDPLYRETAHFVMETGRPSVPTLVNMIVMQLELAGAMHSSECDDVAP